MSSDRRKIVRVKKSVHKLNAVEREMLVEANKLLTILTAEHSAFCTCELCNSAILTDVQDEESFTVPAVTFSDEEPKHDSR